MIRATLLALLLAGMTTIASAGELTIMRFGANYCPTCKQQAQVFATKAVTDHIRKTGLKTVYYKADVDGTEAFDQWKITTIPYTALVDITKDAEGKITGVKLIRQSKQGQLIPQPDLLRFLTPPAAER